jgi:hypothetical protein
MKRNARRVPTAQRVRTFYRLFKRLERWFRPLIAVAVLFLVVRVGWTQFSQSAMFSLKRVEFAAPPKMSQHELLQIAGIKMGTNLLGLDLQQMAARLMQHPQITSVRLRRRYPHTLWIKLTECKAVALADLGGLYYLDRLGRPFAKVTDPKVRDKMLVISGIRRFDYEQKPQATQRLFQQSLALASLYKSRNLSRFQPLKEIQYDPILGYILRAGSGKVYIGAQKFPARLKQLHQLYQLFWRRGVRKFQYVRLDHKHHTRRAIVKLDSTILVSQQGGSPSKRQIVKANHE